MVRGMLLLAFAVLAAGCVSPPGSTDPGPEGHALPAMQFRLSMVDGARDAREPSVAVGPDGTIYICSIRGLGSGTDLYRSIDGGLHFAYVGDDVNAALPPIRNGRPDAGGGDCDLAVDAGGIVYLADLWAGSVSVYSSSDQGRTWNGTPVSQLVGGVDRPWLAGGDQEEVWMVDRQLLDSFVPQLPGNPVGGIYVLRSIDGGMTFPLQVLVVSNAERPTYYSSIARSGERIGFAYERESFANGGGPAQTVLAFAYSDDRGATWKERTITQQPSSSPGLGPQTCFDSVIFPTLAADTSGGFYVTWAYNNTATGRVDLFFARSLDGGTTWGPPRSLADRAGARAYPWMTSGADGHVGIAWYETNTTIEWQSDGQFSCAWRGDTEHAAWYLHYTSGDARAEFPVFTETVVDPLPIHIGSLDRPYAELLQVRTHPSGHAAIAYVADRPEGKARPMFALQVSGPLLD